MTIPDITWPHEKPQLGAVAPAFSPAMLPSNNVELTNFIYAEAEQFQVPVDMVAATLLGITASAASRSNVIDVGWIEPAPVWMAILMDSAERKSAVVTSLMTPWHDWESDEAERLKPYIARNFQKFKKLSLRESHLLKEAAKRPANNNSERELAQITDALSSSLVNACSPSLVTTAFTPEGLRDQLMRSGEKAAIISADVDGSEFLGARYKDQTDIDLLLSGYTGEAVTSRRAGGVEKRLACPAIGIAICVQPESMKPVLTNSGANGRGLVARFNLILPTSMLGYRALHPPKTSPQLKEWWSHTLQTILGVHWAGRFYAEGNELAVSSAKPRVVGLSPTARAAFDRFRETHEARLDDDLHGMKAFAGKQAGTLARLALAMHLLGPESDQAEVGLETMLAALAWGDYLIGHRRAVNARHAQEDVEKLLYRLIGKLQRCPKGQSVPDAFAKMRTDNCPKKEDFMAVLNLGWERGALAYDTTHGASYVVLHPSLLS